MQNTITLHMWKVANKYEKNAKQHKVDSYQNLSFALQSHHFRSAPSQPTGRRFSFGNIVISQAETPADLITEPSLSLFLYIGPNFDHKFPKYLYCSSF